MAQENITHYLLHRYFYQTNILEQKNTTITLLFQTFKNIIIMKNLFSFLIITLLFLASSCKKEKLKPDFNFEPNPTTEYENDGPLSKVTKICDVLSFDDEAHFLFVRVDADGCHCRLRRGRG